MVNKKKREGTTMPLRVGAEGNALASGSEKSEEAGV
jgi:hypothetical protein